MKLCKKWLGKVSEILKPLDTLLRQKLEIVLRLAGKVSEFLIPLDTLLRKKLEIVRKLARKDIRNSETSGHVFT